MVKAMRTKGGENREFRSHNRDSKRPVKEVHFRYQLLVNE